MLSRKSISILSLAALSLIVLLITSRRLGEWAGLDGVYYRPEIRPDSPSPAPAPPAPYGFPDGAHDTTAGEGGSNHRSAFDYNNADMPPRPPRDPLCANFPDTSDILLVMKTGASEAYNRVPTQLMTMLRCLPDFLIFSDMEQRIGGYLIHDSLETVLAAARTGNSDFDLYRRQKACVVDQDNCNKLGDAASEGWSLDKYKNIHIAEKAYTMRPGYNWYIFVDADTYVMWPNLVQWLHRLKPRKKIFLGSGSMINDFMFSHGGSGYVLSQAALAAFVGKNPGIANKYDLRAKNECCGDYLLAVAMHETIKLSVQNVWPTINGEKPHTLPFGPTHWCHPIVTMHHMNSEEINSFWEFEQRLYGAQGLEAGARPKTLLLQDIYDAFLASKMEDKREDWDNLSEDRYYLDKNDSLHHWEDSQLNKVDDSDYNDEEKHAHESFEACARACESLSFDKCFQYRYQNGICATSRAFMLGKPLKPSKNGKNEHSVSGWDIAKINKWIEDQGECTEVVWPEARR